MLSYSGKNKKFDERFRIYPAFLLKPMRHQVTQRDHYL